MQTQRTHASRRGANASLDAAEGVLIEKRITGRSPKSRAVFGEGFMCQHGFQGRMIADERDVARAEARPGPISGSPMERPRQSGQPPLFGPA